MMIIKMRVTALIVYVLLCIYGLNAEDYQNPIIQGNFEAADPGVIVVGDTYYVATTGQDATGTFAIRASTNLVNWTEVGHIFPTGFLPTWYSEYPWAPEIHYIGGKYVAYFAMADTTGLLCVGAAFSSVPQGPYKDIGQPLVRTPGMGSIDPTAFYNDQDQQWYLYYKSNGNAINEPTPIWAQQLSEDGLSLVGNRTYIFENTLAWEGPMVEAPWMIKANSYYYLFYTGGDGYVSTTYSIGVARAEYPLGPFEKYQNGPIITTNSVFAAPGHCSVVAVPNTQQFIFFYAGWYANKLGQGYRMDLLDPVTWDSNFWPVQFTPSSSPQPVPA